MVSIPRLQQIQSSSDVMPDNGRIEQKVQDSSAEILNRTNAVQGVVGEASKVYQDYENDQITQLGYKAEQAYTGWSTEQLAKMKGYEGDPTEGYANLEKQAKEQYDLILSQYPDANERVREGVRAHLDKVVNSQRLHELKQRGAQVETYSNNLYESTVKLKKNNLGLNASYIRKDDPGSFLPFEENIADIKTTIAKRAIDKGTGKVLPEDAKSWNHMYRDDNGNMVKVELNDIAKQKVAKELSEGVSASIDSMVSAGYTEEAKVAMDRYSAYLDPKSTAHLNNKFKTTAVKSTAYNEFGKIDGKSDSEQMKYIDSIKDPQIKDEVLKIKDTSDARRQHITDRREKANYEVTAKHVMDKMNSDDPYHGQADLENDPIVKATFDRLDVQGQKAVREMVNAPKDSNPKSEVAVQNIFFGNDPDNNVENISPEEFQRKLAGLNKTDKAKYTGMYNRMKVQSAGEERSMYKNAGDMLKDQFLIDGHVSRDRFGKISGDDEVELLKAKNELIDHLAKQHKPLNQKELKDFVQSYSAARVSGKVFDSSPKPVFNPSPSKPVAPVAAPIPSTSKVVVLSPKEKVNLKAQFRTLNGYFPTDADEKFKSFVEKQK